jgi:hypothetical protein
MVPNESRPGPEPRRLSPFWGSRLAVSDDIVRGERARRARRREFRTTDVVDIERRRKSCHCNIRSASGGSVRRESPLQIHLSWLDGSSAACEARIVQVRILPRGPRRIAPSGAPAHASTGITPSLQRVRTSRPRRFEATRLQSEFPGCRFDSGTALRHR